jgi:hypothetical protein
MPIHGPLPRRAILKGGLAGLASLLGCSTTEGQPVGPLEDGGDPLPDAGAGDGGDFPFTPVPKPKIASNIGALGDIGTADANGVRMPPGFAARVVAKSGQAAASGKPYQWHSAPDGGAVFGTADGGWIYVSNSEVPLVGGVGALKFDANGTLIDSYRILDGTNVNCAGGPTPWDTWLSCEEIARGRVHECDPKGVAPAVARPALGVFKHEAAAVDPVKHHVYLTEDEVDGRFYRYVPNGRNRHGFANLAEGALEVAEVAGDGTVTWHPVPDPQFTGGTPTRSQVAASTVFLGGEGIWYHAGVVYLTTKGDNKVWAYDTNTLKISTLYDATTATNPVLTGVDNVSVTAGGDVLVAEDGGNMQIVAILPNGTPKVLIELVGYSGSEITGPAFDPSGTRLYFSSQRGSQGGTTFEVTGPWHVPAP